MSDKSSFFFLNCRKYICISHYSHICYISWTSNILFKLTNLETNKREHMSDCLFKSTNESSKYVQTLHYVVQNVPHVSTYSRSRRHTQALMIKIFMSVSNESFIKKDETFSTFWTIKVIVWKYPCDLWYIYFYYLCITQW